MTRAVLADEVVDQNIPTKNTVYRAKIYTEDGRELFAYIKVILPIRIAIERACSALAKSLDLDSPEVFLVKITPEFFPNYSWGTPFVFAVGSQEIDNTGFARLVNNEALFVHALKQYSKNRQVAFFDEFVCNPDRHSRNFVIDGSNRFWLIDHENALDARLCTPGAPSRNNIVFSLLLEGADSKVREAAQAEYERIFRPKLESVELGQVVGVSYHPLISTDAEKSWASSFVTTRKLHLTTLIARMLGDPQQELL